MAQQDIRALYDAHTITVYQAYNKYIAKYASETQTLISPHFSRQRMTWIKPSFLWMMYRSGWATKENQEHVLAIKIKQEGFEWALKNACLSHFEASVYLSYNDWKEKLNKSSVRIQWDPERSILLKPLPFRSIQIGISGIALELYLTKWIVEIVDITDHCKNIHQLVKSREIDRARKLLPAEQIYPLSLEISSKIKSR